MTETNQVHLEAAKQQSQIDDLFEKLKTGEFNSSFQAKIALAVRFFGKNLTKLQECNDSMLKLSRLFLILAEQKYVNWSIRDYNAVLQLITILMLQRRDEGIIRQTSLLIVDFAKSLPASQLKNLVKHHQKVAGLIMHKMSKVFTYYTQMKILYVLKTIFSALDDGGASIIRKEKVFVIRGSNEVNDAIQLFDIVDTENFISTSREFLDFYNEDVIKNGYVRSFEGFVQKINSKKCSNVKQNMIDFGLGNLSVSFFVEENLFSDNKKNEPLFVELEDCEFEVKTSKYLDPEHVELLVKPKRSQILDKTDNPVVYEIKSILLVVINKNDTFMSKVYPLFKTKTPMLSGNLTDNESVISYRTVNSSIVKMHYCSQINEDSNIAKPHQSLQSQDIFSPEAIPNQADPITSHNKDIVDVKQETELVQVNTQIKKEPETKRQTATVVPSVCGVSIRERLQNRKSEKRQYSLASALQVNYDEVPKDEEVLPPFRKFMNVKRNARQQSQELIGSQTIKDSTDENYLVNPEIGIEDKQRPPAKKVKRQTSVSTKSKEVAKAKTALPRKITLRASPKRKVNSMSNISELLSSDEDLDDMVIAQLESRSYRKSELPQKQKPSVAVNLPTSKDVPSLKRRKPLAAVQSSLSPLNKARQQRKLAAREKIKNASPKKRIGDFDLLLKETKAVNTKKETTPVQESKTVNDRNQKKNRGDIPPLLLATGLTPLEQSINVRDNDIKPKYVEESKKSGNHEKTRQKRTSDETSHTEVQPKRAKTFVIESSDQEVSLTKSDQQKLGDNLIMDKFLNDTISNHHSADDMYMQDNFEQMTVNTQVIQTKLSPTMIRTVQIQEVTYTPKRTQAVAHIAVDKLCRIFEQKTDEEIDAALDEMKTVERTLVSANSEEKAAVFQAMSEGREIIIRSKRQSEEFEKLRKRFHYLKTQAMKTTQELSDHIPKLMHSLKPAIAARRSSIKKEIERLEKIGQDFNQKEEEVKIEIWQNYLNGILRNFQNLLEQQRSF